MDFNLKIGIQASVFLSFLLLSGCGGGVGSSGNSGGGGNGGNGTPGVTVAISPRIVNVARNGAQNFSATVGGTTNTGVTWSVLESGGGSIQSNGQYTAPASTGTFTVRATSVADTTKSNDAVVQVADPSNTDPTGIIPLNRVTTWSPGIPGGIPSQSGATIHTTIDAVTYGNGTTDATQAINDAIIAAGAVATDTNRQVVYLPAGNYRVSGQIALNQNNVILRGAGMRTTRIIGAAADSSAVEVGGGFDYAASDAINVVADVAKGAKTITVADASTIDVGDILQIDQQDDSYVWLYDSQYLKRQPGASWFGPETGGALFQSVANPGGPWRSMTQQIEVTKKLGNTLTLRDPIHIAFSLSKVPQVFRNISPRPTAKLGTMWVGIEDMTITGGNNNNIELTNVAYCWLLRVESDGELVAGNTTKPGMIGDSIELTHAYRCVISESYVHHARSVVNGGGAYGIVVSSGSSANLIENNIAVWLNKPIVMNVSGGGNVVAYNYVDNAMIMGTNWQENGIDGCHESFSHSDLFEGNWTPNIGSDSTHGNGGMHTWFRNYAAGRNSMPYDIGGTVGLPDAGMRAAGMDAYSGEHNFVGNVLMAVDTGSGTYYEANPGSHPDGSPVYKFGDNGDGGTGGVWDTGQAAAMAYRHGNWDNVSNAIVWDASAANRTLPNSLYLNAKPAFFTGQGAGVLWPFVDPGRTPRVGQLPAKNRYDAMPVK